MCVHHPWHWVPSYCNLTTTSERLEGAFLVEIISIIEDRVSTFDLEQMRIAREVVRLAGGDPDAILENDYGMSLTYNQNMLSFMLSDGVISIPAMGYRDLPGLSLKSTPLSFKVT